MTTTDELTCKLREIEQEIDFYYKFNPLVNLPFATAAWSLLAFAENQMLNAHVGGRGTQDYAIIGDNLVNELKDPMCWLYSTCEPGGQAPFAYNADIYKASWDLFKLGQEYRWFVFAYTYFSRKWAELDLQGSTIQPTENLFTGMEYECLRPLG